jgi:membrane protease YdiL (CAAX protease family)
MNKEKRNAVITILLYFLVMFGSTIPLNLMGIDIAHTSTTLKIVYSTASETLLMAIIMLLNINVLKKDWQDFKINYKKYYHKYFIYWFKMLGMMVVANIIVSAVTGNLSSANEETIRSVMKYSKLYIVFSAVIYAPIVEELVFRQSIRSLIKRKWAFIITSGFVFGLIHCLGSATLIEYLYIIPYAIPGCVFAYILYDSNNIFNTMSMHLWHNTIMVILELIVIGLGII